MCLDLAKIYPKLKFIVQDRAPVISQAENVWKDECSDALQTQRTKLMVHDFFTEQPVQGAEVYHMRYIMHVAFLMSFRLPHLYSHTGTIGQKTTASRFSRPSVPPSDLTLASSFLTS